jgi:hypothetical protein
MNEAQKYIAVAALAGAAVIAACVEYGPRNSTPAPGGEFSLRGKWIGPNAAEDAAAFAGLCRGIADALEADGSRQQSRITSGVQVEDVRVAAAEGRFLPRRLTQEQPHAVAAAGKFLDEVAGTSGGPLDAAARAKWVQAYRQLATAAEESVR